MTIQRLRTQALAALAASSLFAAGCGGSDEDDVKDAVKEVATAAKDKDAKKFCALVSEKALKQVERSGKKCEQAFTKPALEALAKEAPDPEKIKFDKVTVKKDSATVKINGEESDTKLIKEDGDWKVAP